MLLEHYSLLHTFIFLHFQSLFTLCAHLIGILMFVKGHDKEPWPDGSSGERFARCAIDAHFAFNGTRVRMHFV